MQSIKIFLIRAVYAFFRLFPIKRNNVLLFSYYGEQYSGAPKYIGQYLKGHATCNMIWAFVRPSNHNEVAGIKVRYGYPKFFYHLATAGVIITNYRMTPEFKKRIGQLYIQTWHSSLRLKQIEKDAESTLPSRYIQMAKRDSAYIDVLLAGSKKSKEIFERAFWYEGQIAETGTPQCDMLVKGNERVSKKVKAYFNIPKDAHVAMYAPTFRKNHDTSVYDLDTAELLESLTARFGGTWYLLMRLHPHLVNKSNCFTYSERVLQATGYDDVQELLCICDFLVSDYSAIMFDFSVTRKPCVLYAPDLENYIAKDRNLYFDIDQLPFKNFKDQKVMFEYIRNFDDLNYASLLEEFLRTIGSYDDGHACERVYKLIQERQSV